MIIDSIHASQQDVDLVNKYVRNYLYTLESKTSSLIEDEDEELIYSKILVFLIKENIEITEENLDRLDLSDYPYDLIIRYEDENDLEMSFLAKEEVDTQRYDYLEDCVEYAFGELSECAQKALDYDLFRELITGDLINDDAFEIDYESCVLRLFIDGLFVDDVYLNI